MNKDIFKKMEALKETKIRNDEWLERGEKSLRAYIFSHPPSISGNNIKQTQSTGLLINIFGIFSRYVVTVIIVIVILFIGISATAKESIPGDFLHKWELGVNEKVARAFIFNKPARANFETNLLSKRLNEIVQASNVANVTNKTVLNAHNDFLLQLERTEQSINTLEQNGMEDIAIDMNARFSAILEAHVLIIKSLQNIFGSDGETDLQNTVDAIKSADERVRAHQDELRSEIENSISVGKNATQNTAYSIEAKIEETQKTVNKAISFVELAKLRGINVITESDRLDTAVRAITYAREALSKNMPDETLKHAQGAFEIATQVVTLLEIQLNALELKIEIKSTTTPIIWTPDTGTHIENNSGNNIQIPANNIK